MRSCLIVLLLTTALARAQSEPVVLESPDENVSITFQTVAGNAPAGERLIYSVSFKDKQIIAPSALRLELDGQTPLGNDVRITGNARAQVDTRYPIVAGKTSHARDHHNAVRLQIQENGTAGRKLIVEARAYNDAVAFRYIVPAQPGLTEFRLTREATEFRFPKDAMTWSLVLPNFRSMYESEFLKLPVSAFSNQGGVRSEVLIGLPTLIEVPGAGWLAIMEADVRDYAAMYLVNPSGSWLGHWFESRLAPQIDNTNLCVVVALPHQSPWRTLLVADNPGRFIESTTLSSLNPPSEIADTSWIKPGKTSWNWWSGSIGPDGKPAFNTDVMKHYVDFAAESGLEYMLIDSGWSPRDDITRMNDRVDVPAVVQYAAAKGVKVWIWLHYEPTSRQMNEAFPMFQQWGVAGLKIDFIERDDQQGMNFYYRVAVKAAQHRLMVDFHGSTKPTGIDRTWPNVVGYEAVLGMEQSKAGSRDNPDMHVMLPFTRMLAGMMDYTPGGFDNVTREEFVARMQEPMVTGTRAHHLAMYVVYEAPIQMVSDKPSAYGFGTGSSGPAKAEPSFQFIKDVPAAWDETRALNGVPGEYITIARRRGNNWFLGSMTGWDPREVNIPLTFLGEGAYTAEIYADAPDAHRFPKKVVIEKKEVRRDATLKATLAPGGGYAVRFVPRT